MVCNAFLSFRNRKHGAPLQVGNAEGVGAGDESEECPCPERAGMYLKSGDTV